MRLTYEPPTAEGVYDHITGLLGTVAGLSGGVHLGRVPDDLPTSGRYVLPYAVIWPSPGTPSGGEAVGGGPDLRAQTFTFQTTIAAADPLTVLHATGDVKAVLTGAWVGSGIIRADPFQQENTTVQTDTDVRPARYYTPLVWTLQTNRNP